MTSTATLRRQYPELVASTSPLRCAHQHATPVTFLAGGRHYPTGRVDLRWHPAARPAAEALAAVLHSFRYRFEEPAGGTLACRAITGGAGASLHAHGIALDINPSRNGYSHAVGRLDEPDTGHQEGLLQWGRHTDLPPPLIRAVEAIRTGNGRPVWQWGGRWWTIKDAMHLEVSAMRADIATGINLTTVRGLTDYRRWLNQGDADIIFDTSTPGPNAAVQTLQTALELLGLSVGPTGPDGQYGRNTAAAVAAFQKSRNLPATGSIDPTTATILTAAVTLKERLDRQTLAGRIATILKP